MSSKLQVRIFISIIKIYAGLCHGSMSTASDMGMLTAAKIPQKYEDTEPSKCL